jgi:3-hydroxyacyl-CoA dehydrogenase/enoyl-CoA hydratase/3-hydroxybutyryl-CoA epimerase
MSAFTLSHIDGIAIITIDVPGEPVNMLGTPIIGELEDILERIKEDGSVRAVVLMSGKTDNFVAGADIQEFTRIASAAEGQALSQKGQEMIARLELFPKPIVVAIHGACVGLGCELSLACAWRIATDSPKTVIGLPEVQIGILPGAGGCQRLPRLIGVRAALDIILAGKTERAAKAFKIGLVDELVPPSILRSVALAAADRLARNGPADRRKRGSLLLERNPLGRRLVYSAARKTVLRKTGGHYPAPLAALEAVRTGLEHGMAAGLRREAELFGELAVGEVSRNLVRIFFATTALKKDDGIPPGSAAPRPVRRLGVVGAGFMGAGIAGTAVAQASVEARLKDADLPKVGKGLFAATEILRGQLTRRRITRVEFDRKAALLSGSWGFSGFERADVVIEAVFEDLDVKRRVMHDLEDAVQAETIIASNTSTIPDRQHRRGRAPPGADARHALLLSGGPDASPRGHPDCGHGARGNRHGGAVRPPDGQDGHRRRGPARFLGQPDSVPVHQRSRSAAGRGHADRDDRQGDDPIRVPGRPHRAARRGRNRRGAEGRGRDAGGVR